MKILSVKSRKCQLREWLQHLDLMVDYKFVYVEYLVHQMLNKNYAPQIVSQEEKQCYNELCIQFWTWPYSILLCYLLW